MDKPKSLSVKDYIIRKMSIKMLIPEKTIDAVITHQFSSAHEALNTNNSVEISGFGKFVFNEKKAAKKLERYYMFKETFEKTLADENASEQKKRSSQTKLNNIVIAIKALKTKINESKSNLRGVEEPSNPIKED